MANTVGTLVVKLRAEIAEFTSDMGKAGKQAEKTAAQMKREMKKQAEEAKDSIDLLSDAIGIRLPRELKVAIGESRGFASVLSKVGNFSMFAAGATIIADQLVPAIKEAATWLGGYTEEVQKAEQAHLRLNREQMTAAERMKQLKREYELIGLSGAERTRQEIKHKRDDIAEMQAEIDRRRAALTAAIATSKQMKPVEYRVLEGGVAVREVGGPSDAAIRARDSINGLKEEITALETKSKTAKQELENLSKQLSIDLKNGATQGALGLKAVADELMHISNGIPENMAEIDHLARTMSAWGDQLKTVQGLVTGGGDEVTEFWKKYDEEAKKVQNTSQQVKDGIEEDLIAMEQFGAEVGAVAAQATLFGRSWGDAFRSVLVAAAQLVVQMTLMKSLSSMQPGSGGGFFSGLLRTIFGGFRASGGPVSEGTSYVVGERGPELFVPSGNGYILPEMPVLAAAGGPTINYNIDARGADPGVELRIVRALKEVENRAAAKAVRTMQEISLRR